MRIDKQEPMSGTASPHIRSFARSIVLAAAVAAVALIGCSGVATRAPETDVTGSLTLGRAANGALSVDWTLSRECVVGGVEKGRIEGVSSSTESTETHEVSGTGGTVTFTGSAFTTEGATVALTCDGTTVVEETIAAPAPTTGNPPPTTGNPPPITGSLTLGRAANRALSVDWTLSRECVVGGVEKGRIEGVSSSTESTETHEVSGTGGTVTFTGSAFTTEGAKVSLTCDGTTVVEETIAGPDAPTGSLTLSRGDDYSVSAGWSFTKTCDSNPRIRATASGSAADSVDLTGTRGSETFSTAQYRNVSATVELRCDGVALATETIAAPEGSLTLTRDSSNNVEAAWKLDPTCASGKVITSPSGDTTTHDTAISGTSGTVTTSDTAYTEKGADVKLLCNDAEIATATIAEPPTGSLTLSRGDDYSVSAEWSFTRTCDSNPQIRATASGSTADSVDLTGTSGSETFSTAKYRNVSATVELRCDGVALATETIAAPEGSLTLTRDSSNNVEAAWTLDPTCASGKVTTSPSGETATHDTAISGTSGTVTTSDTAYTTKGADVSLLCNDAEIATASIDAPITGSLTLSRGGDYSVSAGWSFTRTCDSNPRIRATASGSTADSEDLTGTSGTETFSTAKYRNVSATVELRCDGVALATETIAAPEGSLTLTRDSSNNVEAAWKLDPTCASGKVITSPSGETATHDTAISGTSGTVTTSDTAYTTKGADVSLLCNDAEIATATIDAPITGSLTLSRDDSNDIVTAWSLSRACPGSARIFFQAKASRILVSYPVSGTSGSVTTNHSRLRLEAADATLRCDNKTVATASIAAP